MPTSDTGLTAGHSCQEVLPFTREGSPGVIRVVFDSGPGLVVGGGGWGAHEGGVSRVDGGYLNLHRPAAVRGLIEAALADGRRFGRATQVDGWRYFDAVAASVPPARAPHHQAASTAKKNAVRSSEPGEGEAV